MIVSILFILTHIGIGWLIYKATNYGGSLLYYGFILCVALSVGICLGFKSLLKLIPIFVILLGIGWYTYKHVDICPSERPLRGENNQCYSCSTLTDIQVSDPNINPCPNRVIRKSYCCRHDYYYYNILPSPDKSEEEYFFGMACNCISAESMWLRTFVVIFFCGSFYISIWGLFLQVIHKFFRHKKS